MTAWPRLRHGIGDRLDDDGIRAVERLAQRGFHAGYLGIICRIGLVPARQARGNRGDHRGKCAAPRLPPQSRSQRPPIPCPSRSFCRHRRRPRLEPAASGAMARAVAVAISRSARSGRRRRSTSAISCARRMASARRSPSRSAQTIRRWRRGRIPARGSGICRTTTGRRSANSNCRMRASSWVSNWSRARSTCRCSSIRCARLMCSVRRRVRCHRNCSRAATPS